MHAKPRLLTKSAILLLAMSLVVLLFVVFIESQQATATNSSDLTKVQNYVNAYINKQYGTGGNEGESGFLIDAGTLYNRLTGGGTSILGEGTDAANVPVLVDNYGSNTTWIPGTSNRCFWNTGAGGTGSTENCFDNAVLDQIKAKADAHAAAGFSTDIIFYCVSGHTEAPTTGGMGYVAQTGRLRGDSSIPNVYALKWGRNGWTNTIATYPNASGLSAASAVYSYTPPSSVAAATACNSSAGDAELVRCEAQWAIYNGTVNGMTGGNVGNGQTPGGTSPSNTLTAGQIVDVRTDGAASTVKYGTVPTVNIPINSLFNTGLTNVNPTATSGVLVVTRTPMVGGIVAEGLKMLGEGMATGGFMNGGVPKWNTTLDEKQVSDGLTRPTLTSTAIDTTAPTVSSVSAGSVTTNSAVINRVANEPATMKIQYGTSPGVYTNTVNNTVLNANKNVTLSSLAPATTYYYQVTSYDGQANGTASSEQSFTTADNTAPVVTVPSNMTVTATGPSGAVVTFTVTATDPDDTAGPVTCTPASGSTFPVGTTTVTCSSTDTNGNTGTASFTVTVTYTDSTPPAISSILPSGLINTNNADVSAYYSDSGSGVNPASASITWDGTPLSGCTATANYISCPQTGLPQGSHTIGVSVADNSGNVATGSGSVFIDSLAPWIGGINPKGNISVNSAAITAYLADGAGRAGWSFADDSGLNDSTLAVTLDGASVAGCTITDMDPYTNPDGDRGFVQCPAVTGLAQGSHLTAVTISDNAGNTKTGTRTFTVDTIAPSVSVTADATTITGTYSDTGTGINTASVAVTLDGTPVSGCTVTASSVSCATPGGLAAGTHIAAVSVKDNAGNLGSGSASFDVAPPCTAGKPALGVNLSRVYWASYADYTAGKLSIDYTMSDGAGTNAANVQITNATASNGVIPLLSTPLSVGDIASGSSALVTLQYQVPNGVSSFHASLYASAEDSCGTTYTYP